MAKNIAHYGLSSTGYIDRWLACGVDTKPIDHLQEIVASNGTPFGYKRRWILNYWAYHPQSIELKLDLLHHTNPFTWQPKNEPVLNAPAVEGQTWRYTVAEQDGMIDFSTFNFRPQVMRGWLYAGLYANKAITVQAEIRTISPTQLWLNGALHTQFDETFSYVAALTVPVTLSLNAGINTLYLHSLTFGWREARLGIGLHFPQKPKLQVAIPIGAATPEQWQHTEKQLAQIRLKQFAFPKLPAMVELSEQASEPLTVDIEVSIPTSGSPWAKFGDITLPSAVERVTIQPGQRAALPLTQEVLQAFTTLPGENSLALAIRPADSTPLTLSRHIWTSANEFSTQPYSDYDSRRNEALHHLAQMPFSVFGAIAALETGKRDHIPSEAVSVACSFLENRFDCADFYAIKLLALLYWYDDSPALHPADKTRIENIFFNFKFWLDEPGLDAMCYFTENHQILFHVTAYLAGQRWNAAIFHNSGLSGKEQFQRADERIRNWILRRLHGNYSEWDSNAYMALDIYAMLALVEFAESDSLRAMAETLLNKTFFMIAAQSFRGVHGSTHGRCYVEGLKSGRVENTSSLQRLAWGMGIFNGETRATGLLALTKRYRIPQILQQIGADVERTVTTIARSNAAFRLEYDMRDDEWDITTYTRRTADYMLSAAIDHRCGEMGVQEHLWQATLSSEAVIFTTYPGNSQEHGHARPNFWAGSARLPRVVMYERTVLCLYRIETGVGLEFTHAYFPTTAFDEWQIEGQWAFARYGNGYAALWGDGDLRLTTEGRHAAQEIRSAGNGFVWLCYVGSAAEDGDFTSFCQKVLQNVPQNVGNSIKWTTPQGDKLSFGWDTPFTVNDALHERETSLHYANAYTQTPTGAEVMTITYEGQSLRLDLTQGKTF
jgi:hypothetical protein